MVNEVLQWAVLAGLGVLLLGLVHQLAGATPSRTDGPSGPEVGRRLPDLLVDKIQRAEGDGSLPRRGLVAFVVESCIGCQHLLASLQQRSSFEDRPVVLVAKQPSSTFLHALNDIGHPVIQDDGALWQACGITNTPLIVEIDDRGQVLAKGVTHNVDAVGQPA